MNTIDYIYRFDPRNPAAKPVPPTRTRPGAMLEDGNRMFSQWMESCRTGRRSAGEPRYVVQCNGLEVGMPRTHGRYAQAGPVRGRRRLLRRSRADRDGLRPGVQRPLRDPRRGQRAGRRLPGEHRFRLERPERKRQLVVVMLGHSGCGAVTGAVDAYLRPLKFWSKSISHAPDADPADLRRGPRSGQRLRGGLGARRPRHARLPGGPDRDRPSA